MQPDKTKLQDFGKGLLIGFLITLVFVALSAAYLSQPGMNLGGFAALLLVGVPIFILVNILILVIYSQKKRWWIVLGQAVILLVPVIWILLNELYKLVNPPY